jgi:hypothetical protein
MRALGFHFDRDEFDAFLIHVCFTSRANTPAADESRAKTTPSCATELPPQHRSSSYFTLEQVLAAFYDISSNGKSVTFKDLKKVCKQAGGR